MGKNSTKKMKLDKKKSWSNGKMESLPAAPSDDTHDSAGGWVTSLENSGLLTLYRCGLRKIAYESLESEVPGSSSNTAMSHKYQLMFPINWFAYKFILHTKSQKLSRAY